MSQKGFSSIALLILVALIFAGGVGYYFMSGQTMFTFEKEPVSVHSYKECVDAGYPVKMTSSIPGTSIECYAPDGTVFPNPEYKGTKPSPTSAQTSGSENSSTDMTSVISVTPRSATVGTQVSIQVIKGRSFPASGNSIHIGKGCIENVKAVNSTLITFAMPDRVDMCHDAASQGMDTQPVVFESGRTPGIYVSDANGNSSTIETLTFVGVAPSVPGMSTYAETSQIRVITPNGGEAFKASDPINVQWEGPQRHSFFLSLLGDPAEPYCTSPNANYEQAFAGDETGNSFMLQGDFMLKMTEGNTCRFKVKVRSNIDGSIFDQSDNYFTVSP